MHGAGIYDKILGILMGSMAHHFSSSTMDPSWVMMKGTIREKI
jgi:hypothetical protein